MFSAVSCLAMELAALGGPETGPVNWKVVVYKASFNAISIGHCSRAVQFLPDEDFCSRRGSYRDLSIVVTQRQGGSPLRAGMRKDLMRYTQSFKTTVTNWAHVLRAEFEFLWRLAYLVQTEDDDGRCTCFFSSIPRRLLASCVTF